MPSPLERDLDQLLARVDRLTPDATRRWGTMTPHQAVVHMADGLRVCLCELPTTDRSNLFVRLFLVPMVLYGPWPKGVKGPAEVMKPAPDSADTFADDVATLKDLLARVASRPASEPWGVHPLFGRLNAAKSKRLMWRHLHHHLRQFSV